jgi:hypothetical protein
MADTLLLLLLLLLLSTAVCGVHIQALGGNGGGMQAAQVSSAMLSDLAVTDCYASGAGGAFSFLASTNVTLQSSTFFNNTAPLGAGLAADSSQLALQGMNISSNLAVEEEATEEGGRRRRRLQQAVRLEVAVDSMLWHKCALTRDQWGLAWPPSNFCIQTCTPTVMCTFGTFGQTHSAQVGAVYGQHLYL